MAIDIDQKPELITTGNWTARRWFNSLVIFLLIWIAIYFIVHTSKVHSGYMNVKFTSEQIQQINRILYAKDDITPVESIVTTTTTDTTRIVDTTKKDTATRIVHQAAPATQYIAYFDKCDDSCRVRKAMLYMDGEFDNNIKPEQLAIIKEYISSFSAQEVGAFLVNLKLKVKSYFWLTGPLVYMEIVFWSIIGVVCSTLFAVSLTTRMAGNEQPEFSTNEIPYQIAKLFYAPVCAIVIILCYNYIKHRNVIEVNTNEGMIVFSFMCGLFAGRMMNLLERVKDLLLPEDLLVAREGVSKVATAKAGKARAEALAEKKEEPVAEKISDKERYAPTIYEYETMVDEVVVELRLDVSGLFEEEKDEIMDIGFDNAVVTLHSVNGKDVIHARKTGDKHIPLFLAANVDAGIYIVRCTLTQTLSDNYVINLFGEKTAYITRDNKELELYIKKYEAID